MPLALTPFLLALGLPSLTSKPPMTTEGKLKRSRNPLDFDFTEPEALTRYVTETGKILPRKADRPHRPPAASYCQGREARPQYDHDEVNGHPPT